MGVNEARFDRVFAPYFNCREKWGDIKAVDVWHIHMLWSIRDHMAVVRDKDWPMIMHCSYETRGHAPRSYHYAGLASDFHFQTEAPLSEQYRVLCGTLADLNLEWLVGLGVYPEWTKSPGFHIDSRGSRMRWIKRNGKYEYRKTADIADMLYLDEELKKVSVQA